MSQRSRQLGKVASDEAAKGFIYRFVDGLSRFDDVLVCGDCNTADAEGKKIVTAPENFSFSPAEIREFCRIAPNQAHAIDTSRVRSTFKRAAQLLTLRYESAVRLADKAILGTHWFEVTDFASRPERVELHARRIASMYGGGIAPIALARATLKPSVFDTWRRSFRVEGSAPDEQDLRFLAERNHQRWHQYPDDWACPCCRRDKRAAVSKTNAGKWQFKPGSAKFSEGQYVVCHDCVQTDRDFRKEAENLLELHSAVDAIVSITQLQSIIRPQPHTKHNINEAEVMSLLSMLRNARTDID